MLSQGLILSKWADHADDRGKERLQLTPQEMARIRERASKARLGPAGGHIPLTTDAGRGWAVVRVYGDEPTLTTILAAHMRPTGEELAPLDLRSPPPKVAAVGPSLFAVSRGPGGATLTHSYGGARDRDLELWREWKRSPTPENLKALMKALDPVIASEVRRWSGQVPQVALEAQAQKLAYEAIQSYDPNAGAALSTHVLNRLRKLSRTVYENQDMLRVSETVRLDVNKLYKAEMTLSAQDDERPPTVHELADHLGWSPRKVTQVQKMRFGEYVESQDTGGELFSSISGGAAHDFAVDYVYHDLAPDEKIVFEGLTGYGGKPVKSVKQIAQETGRSIDSVGRTRRKIVQKLKRHASSAEM